MLSAHWSELKVFTLAALVGGCLGGVAALAGALLILAVADLFVSRVFSYRRRRNRPRPHLPPPALGGDGPGGLTPHARRFTWPENLDSGLEG